MAASRIFIARKCALTICLAACGSPRHPASIDGAPVVDRFSSSAGTLQRRDKAPGLPAPGAPIDLDQQPFVTRGLGPDGRPVRYFNFDVQSPVPALRYRIVRAGTHDAIAGQDDVIDVIPGATGYSDFWRIAYVDAPAGFTPGSITRVAQLDTSHAQLSANAIDCPVVPSGTTTHEAHAPHADSVWYRGAKLTCLHFEPELPLAGDKVPTSPIYVTFASEGAFRTEHGGESAQTHNVVFSLPGDLDYSPLWDVHIYAKEAFDRVSNAGTAADAPSAGHGPLVNCPIVAF